MTDKMRIISERLSEQNPVEENVYRYIQEENDDWNPPLNHPEKIYYVLSETFLKKFSRKTSIDQDILRDIFEKIAFNIFQNNDSFCADVFLQNALEECRQIFPEEFPEISSTEMLESCWYQNNFDENIALNWAIHYLLHQLEGENRETFLIFLCENELSQTILLNIAQYLVFDTDNYFDLIQQCQTTCMERSREEKYWLIAARQLFWMIEPVTSERRIASQKKIRHILGVTALLSLIGWILLLIYWGIIGGDVFLKSLLCVLPVITLFTAFWRDCKTQNIGIGIRQFRVFCGNRFFKNYREYYRIRNGNWLRNSILSLTCIGTVAAALTIVGYILYQDIPYLKIYTPRPISINGEPVTAPVRISKDEMAYFYGDDLLFSDFEENFYLSVRDWQLIQERGQKENQGTLMLAHEKNSNKNYNNRESKLYAQKYGNLVYQRKQIQNLVLFDPEYKIYTEISNLPTHIGNTIFFDLRIYSEHALEFSENPEKYILISNYGFTVIPTDEILVSAKEIEHLSNEIVYRIIISNIPMDPRADYNLCILAGLASNREFPVVRSPEVLHRMVYPENEGTAEQPYWTSNKIGHAYFNEEDETYEIPQGGSFYWDLILHKGTIMENEVDDFLSHLELTGFTADMNAAGNFGATPCHIRIYFTNIKSDSENFTIIFPEGVVVNPYHFLSKEETYQIPLRFSNEIIQPEPKFWVDDQNPFSGSVLIFPKKERCTFTLSVKSNSYFKISDFENMDVTDYVLLKGLTFQKAECSVSSSFPRIFDGDTGYLLNFYLTGIENYETEMEFEISPELLFKLVGIESVEKSGPYRWKLVETKEELPPEKSEHFRLLSENEISRMIDQKQVKISYQYSSEVENIQDWKIKWNDRLLDFYSVRNQEDHILNLYVFTEEIQDKIIVVQPFYYANGSKYLLPQAKIVCQ